MAGPAQAGPATVFPWRLRPSATATTLLPPVTRGAGMAAAQRFIEEHGGFLDDLERQLDAPHCRSEPEAAA